MGKTLNWVDWMTSAGLTGRATFLAAVLFIYGVIAACIPISPDHGDVPDINSYLAMGRGDYGSCYAPFSSRILDPFLAFWVSRFTHLPTETCFAVIAGFAVAIFIFAALQVINLENASLIWLFPCSILLSPWLIETAQAYLMPEMLHAMIAVCVFWALARESRLWPLLLLLLYITRESTILLTFALLAVFVLRRRRLSALAAIVATVVGMLIQHKAASLARPNIHDISDGPYLVEKVFHHGTLNLTGLHFLANSSHFYNHFHKLWTVSVPLSFMDITQIAFLGFEPYFPLVVAMSLLTLFGIAPLVVGYGISQRGWRFVAQAPVEVAVAVIYSVLCLMASPFLGDAVARYVTAAWPLAIIALPWMMRQMNWNTTIQKKLLLAHVAACWSPVLCGKLFGHGVLGMGIVCVCGLAAQIAAWRSIHTSPHRSIVVQAQVSVAAAVTRE